MNKILGITILILWGMSFPAESQNYRNVENTAWQSGEKLTYKVYYHSNMTGNIKGGTGHLKVKETDTTYNGRDVYRFIAHGKSEGILNFFIKVREHFESFTDKKALVPHYFIRRTREGNYRKNDEVRFDYDNNKAYSWYDTTDFQMGVQDIISATYFARNMNFDTIQEGDMYHVDYFVDDSVYVSAIQFFGYDTIETDYGKFRCLGFKPKVAVGQVFKEPYPGKLWITDDKNRLPIKAKSEVFVGRVKLELIKAEGVRNRETGRISKDKRMYKINYAY
ncbi:MAG: DUF3108 domain-containing protein [Bacteroidales bacterium]|nr:DUF3108 domain-containing protein [Bacteroidales bacterium]